MNHKITRVKNKEGLYDVGLISVKPFEVICLYEDLNEKEWKESRKSGKLEEISNNADQILLQSDNIMYFLC